MKRTYIKARITVIKDSDCMLLAGSGGGTMGLSLYDLEIAGSDGDASYQAKQNQKFQDDWSDDLNENGWNIDGL